MLNPFAVGLSFGLVDVLFALATGIFLGIAYARTRLSGFLWLMAAIVIWPALAGLSTLAVGMTLGGLTSASHRFPLSSLTLIVNVGDKVIGGSLLLTSVIILGNQVSRRLRAVNPPPPAAVFPSAG
jgi:hypothetical protein